MIFCDLARKDSARVPVGPPGSRTQYPLQSLLDASSWLKSEPAAMGDSCEQSFKLMIQAFSRIVHLSVSQLELCYQQSVDQYPESAQNGGANNPDAHSGGKRNPRFRRPTAVRCPPARSHRPSFWRAAAPASTSFSGLPSAHSLCSGYSRP